MTQGKIIRILIVDDSKVSRSLLKAILETDSRFQLVGEASNGDEGIKKALELRPDLITMDVNMPGIDGYEATERIMQAAPVPVVMVSSYYKGEEEKMKHMAFQSGAVKVLPKPGGVDQDDFEKEQKEFLQMLFLMSELKVIRKHKSIKRPSGSPLKTITTHDKSPELVCIGASAGGPAVVRQILESIESPMPFAVLLVQHVDKHFSSEFANWLGLCTNKKVIVARHGQAIEKNVVYIAPGNKHLGLLNLSTIQISDAPAVNGCKPSVSYLFNSVTKCCADKVLAILLSGMGKDGAVELKKMRDLGVITIAQNQESALVFGMPGEAIKLGGASMVLSPDEISNYIKNNFKNT